MDLDGAVWSDETVSMNTLICGPNSLLAWLEGRLGLRRPAISDAERLFAYRKKVELADSEWCRSSFKLDPIGTTKKLLAWRDELVMAGWDGKIVSNASQRLQSLAAIEQAQTEDTFPGGIGDRIKAVLSAMQQGIFQGELVLDTPKAFLPELWKQVVVKLHECGMTVSEKEMPPAPQNQRIVVEGSDEMVLAKELVRYLFAGTCEENRKVAVIAEGSTTLLDRALHQFGFGAIGHSEKSSRRPILQLIPLWLELLWKPFNPRTFLELLSLPVLPFSHFLARKLSKAVSNQPGIGGNEWDDAWKNEKNEKEEETCKWKDFLETDCFQAEKKVTGEKVVEWCSKLAGVLGRKAATDGAESEVKEIRLALSDLKILQNILVPKEEYDKGSLARIVDLVLGEGNTAPGVQAEVTPFVVFSSPAAVSRPFDTILWWNFTSHGMQKDTEWSMEEKNAIPGLALNHAQATVTSWHRALNYATRHLIAFTPHRIAGDEAFQHSLADEFTFKDPKKPEMPYDAEKITPEKLVNGQGEWHLAGRSLELEKITPEPFQTQHMISPEIAKDIQPRSLSYSQLSTFLGCPFQWFLKKCLNLEKAPIESIATGNRMLGNLTHKVVETLFDEQKEWMPEEAYKQAGKLFDDLVPKMAAELLQPSSTLDKKRYKETLQKAIQHLVTEINARGLKVVETEKNIEGLKFQEDIPFSGRIDIYLEDAQKQPYVIDLKWSSSIEYDLYRNKAPKDTPPPTVSNNDKKRKALQLATYAWQLKPEDLAVKCAFYLFPKSELKEGYFAKSGSDWNELWDEAKNLWKKKMAEMHEGNLECAANNDICKYCDFNVICGREEN